MERLSDTFRGIQPDVQINPYKMSELVCSRKLNDTRLSKKADYMAKWIA
jgi:hypothetical protein